MNLFFTILTILVLIFIFDIDGSTKWICENIEQSILKCDSTPSNNNETSL